MNRAYRNKITGEIYHDDGYWDDDYGYVSYANCTNIEQVVWLSGRWVPVASAEAQMAGYEDINSFCMA